MSSFKYPWREAKKDANVGEKQRPLRRGEVGSGVQGEKSAARSRAGTHVPLLVEKEKDGLRRRNNGAIDFR